MARRGRLMVLAGVATVAAAVLAWFTVPYPTTHVGAGGPAALDTPARVAGWADDVFVGLVRERLSVEHEGELPVTVAAVTVVRTLKGRVAGPVRVAQAGGDEPLRRSRVVVGRVPLIEPGRLYVLATRVDPRGWHTSPAGFAPVELVGESATTVATWTEAVRHPQARRDDVPSEAAASADRDGLYRRARVT